MGQTIYRDKKVVRRVSLCVFRAAVDHQVCSQSAHKRSQLAHSAAEAKRQMSDRNRLYDQLQRRVHVSLSEYAPGS
jgi:hypothetical protein